MICPFFRIKMYENTKKVELFLFSFKIFCIEKRNNSVAAPSGHKSMS